MYKSMEEIIDDLKAETDCCENCIKRWGGCHLGECYNEHKTVLESMLIEAYLRGQQVEKDKAARKAAEEEEV